MSKNDFKKQKKEIIIDNKNLIIQKLKIDNKSNQSNRWDKKDFEDPKNVKKFLEKNNISNESFELGKYIGSKGESVVHSINVINNETRETKEKSFIKIFYKIRNERVKKEIYISKKLKNQNIINFLGQSRIEEGKPGYIIMEEAEFGNIRNFQRKILKKNTLSETIICFLAYQILNGIKYCHKCKIAHMNIKLQNIVIDKYLNAKLIDFSSSLNYKNKRDEITLPCKGTNFYMPKEVLLSKKIKIKDLSKIDLYAFGVVLFYLALNRYPYGLTHCDEENYEKILNKINKGELGLQNCEDYSSYFLDFLEKLLQKDIEKRISLSQALDHYWIKGGNILLDEKEKCFNTSAYIGYLITDQIKAFNDYMSIENANIVSF